MKTKFILFLLLVVLGCGPEEKKEVNDNEVQLNDSGLINKIINDSTSDNELSKDELSDEQVEKIFNAYNDKESLSINGEKNSKSFKHENLIEREYGSKDKIYPYNFYQARKGECGTDTDDIVAAYFVPWGPNIAQDDIKYYSNPSFLSWVLNSYYRSGLSANGFGTTNIRVCLGGKTKQVFGSDLWKFYLWHK